MGKIDIRLIFRIVSITLTFIFLLGFYSQTSNSLMSIIIWFDFIEFILIAIPFHLIWMLAFLIIMRETVFVIDKISKL